jgi:hypothetical protein
MFALPTRIEGLLVSARGKRSMWMCPLAHKSGNLLQRSVAAIAASYRRLFRYDTTTSVFARSVTWVTTKNVGCAYVASCRHGDSHDHQLNNYQDRSCSDREPVRELSHDHQRDVVRTERAVTLWLSLAPVNDKETCQCVS